jgi:hypothetical protein
VSEFDDGSRLLGRRASHANCQTKNNMQTQTIRLRGLAVAAAVTAIYLVVGAYVNLPLREALKRAVGGHVPCWLDHITFMLLANLVVATLLAWKLVGLGQVFCQGTATSRGRSSGASAPPVCALVGDGRGAPSRAARAVTPFDRERRLCSCPAET